MGINSPGTPDRASEPNVHEITIDSVMFGTAGAEVEFDGVPTWVLARDEESGETPNLYVSRDDTGFPSAEWWECADGAGPAPKLVVFPLPRIHFPRTELRLV